MLSLYTIGAIASKNANCWVPVKLAMYRESFSAVRGPVAIITFFQSSGISCISSLMICISGSSLSFFSTHLLKPILSTASALPAGTLFWSAQCMMIESQRLISSCRTPTALWVLSSERKELEHTNSAIVSV